MSVQIAKHCFTVAEYERMGAAGIFSEDERVELIEGEIVEMSPIGERHAACVDALAELLRERLRRSVNVRVQNPIRLDEHSEPQPDIAILRRREDAGFAHAFVLRDSEFGYLNGHPVRPHRRELPGRLGV